MTHPNPHAPGNVPLYRCRWTYKQWCLGKNCQHHVIRLQSEMPMYVQKCPASSLCMAVYVVSGFRTLPDCHYCIHVQSASQCSKCEDKDKYTPRQPGKI